MQIHGWQKNIYPGRIFAGDSELSFRNKSKTGSLPGCLGWKNVFDPHLLLRSFHAPRPPSPSLSVETIINWFMIPYRGKEKDNWDYSHYGGIMEGKANSCCLLPLNTLFVLERIGHGWYQNIDEGLGWAVLHSRRWTAEQGGFCRSTSADEALLLPCLGFHFVLVTLLDYIREWPRAQFEGP